MVFSLVTEGLLASANGAPGTQPAKIETTEDNVLIPNAFLAATQNQYVTPAVSPTVVVQVVAVIPEASKMNTFEP